MYKKYTINIGMAKLLYQKTLLIMRLTTVILIASLLQVSAATFGQRITINRKNVALEAVLKEIRRQSGYDIYYDSQLIPKNRQVTVVFTDATLNDALISALEGLNLSYDINGNIINIKKKEKPSVIDRLVAQFQTIDINGVVKNESGTIMEGATVVAYNNKGYRKTVRSNSKGEFRINDVPDDAQLSVSFIGYKSFHLNLKNAVMPLEIKLGIGSSDLEEIGVTINTGYLKITPLQSTGAVSQITTKQYESQINVNFLDGIQNKMPGLLINNDVQFKGNSLFQVRGLSTFSASSSPLIVMDGYPTDLSINNINPNEIKSITLLKDAAAAAIYGVKASNGVLVVERKEASSGAPRVNFRTTFSIKPPENYSSYRWAPEDTYINYLRYQYKDGATASPTAINTNNNIIPGLDIIYQKAAGYISQAQMEQAFSDLTSYNNTADYKRLFQRTGLTQAYNLDVSGGNNFATYYVTGAFTNAKTTSIKNDNNGAQLSARININFNKRLSLQLIDDYNEGQTNMAPVIGINSVYPWERFQDAYGKPAPVFGMSITNALYNERLMSMGLLDAMGYPLIDVNEVSTKSHSIDNRFTANFTYNFGHGLQLLFGGVYERSTTNERYYASVNSSVARQTIDYFAIPNPSGPGIQFRVPVGGYLKTTNSELSNYTLRTQLTYNKTFGENHKISAILGAEQNKSITQGGVSSMFGYDDQTLIQQAVDYKALSTVASAGASPYVYAPYIQLWNNSNLFSQRYTDNRFVSAYANAYYTFKNLYSITGSMRVDQSNLFGTDPKYRYKPLWSVGGGWNVSHEKFMENLNWIHNLKLRAAKGFDGNVAKFSIPQIIASSVFNNITKNQGLALYSPANGGLRWETTDNLNFGLDYSIFKGISGSVDYYIKKSKDLLTTVNSTNTDPTIGANPGGYGGINAYMNAGSMINKGLEFNLNADWISKSRFNWYTGFILAFNNNKVTKAFLPLDDKSLSLSWTSYGNSQSFIPDYSSGAIFSYRFAGLGANGTPKIYDQNGNVIESPGTALYPDGGRNWVEYSGTTIPRYNAGMSNRFDIGDFYFYFKLDYFGGNKVRLPVFTPDDRRPIQGSENFWRKPGDETYTNIINPNASMSYTQSIAYRNADVFTLNGSYVTLSAVTLSYNLAKIAVFQKAKIKRFELLLQGNNLYTHGFNKYNYSLATGSYVKRYLTPTYTIGLYTDF